MNQEVKMQSDLRHIKRNEGIVLTGMFILIGLCSAVAGLTRYTNKPVSYTFTAATFGVMGLGAVKVSQLNKRGKDIARQLDAARTSKQNG